MRNFIQSLQPIKSKSKSPFITILMLALALIFTSPTRVLAVGSVGFSSAEIGMIAGGAGVVAVGAVSALIASLSKSKNNNSQIVSIVVTPSNVTIHNGTVQQFTATGTYSDGSTHDLTNSIAWTSSDLTVATISNTAGSNGLAKALKTGSTVTTTITATDPASGIQDSATLTLNTAVLTSIEVTPPNVTVHNNTTQQFTAIGIYSDSSTQNLTNSVTWTSSNSTIATIDNTAGSNGLATIAITGSTITDNITATDPSTNIQGNTILTVNTATLSSIVVTPLGTTTIHGGTTQQFTATGIYYDNSTQDLTNSVTWSSSVPTIATISNNTGSKGLATASVAIGGITTISATITGKTSSATLTVNASATLQSIAVTSSNLTIHNGTTQQFTAMGSYDDGTKQNLTNNVTWGPSGSAVAMISNTGLATAVAAGTVNITATFSGIQGTTPLIVNTTVALQSIAMTSSNLTIHNGTAQQFTAIGTYNDNSTQDLTSSVTWSSSSNTVATISNAPGSNGLATAVATGAVNITATDPASGIQSSATLTVSAATLTSITVNPSTASVPNGTTRQFTATGNYDDNSTQDLTSSVTWSSSSNVATISNAPGSNGVATAVAIGSATITATYPGTSTKGTAMLVVPSSNKAITAYTFASSSATEINETAKTIVVTVPAGTVVTSLVATFITNGTSVAVGGTIQVSGTTSNNFTNPVTYTVTAADGSTANYTVTVVVSPPNKAITAYAFVSPNLIGVINETNKTIVVTVPPGTNKTNLVATFVTNGASIAVGSVHQDSGVTPNDFTNPVTYTVTAADGSSVGYTVTVAFAATKLLYSFSHSVGQNSRGSLVQGHTDGYFYGTTSLYGSGNNGMVFKITSLGDLTILHPFAGTPNDGSRPTAGLVQSRTDGNFYGTTYSGGANDCGTVFKIGSTVEIPTILYSFACGSDGANPAAGLVQGNDGFFYGTTQNGGSGGGTVFKIGSTVGTPTILYRFTGSDGSSPLAGLVQGTDGNFYGTTYSGGSGYGTVFKIPSTGGTPTTLHSFTSGSDGANPQTYLVQGNDGYFYGTTYYGGGVNNNGTVFKVNSAGSYVLLHSFTGTGGDGAKPGGAALVQGAGADSNFYGVTESGGANGCGTVFKIGSTAGSYVLLYSVAGGPNDAKTLTSLVLGADYNLYGTSNLGGANSDSGTIFEMSLNNN